MPPPLHTLPQPPRRARRRHARLCAAALTLALCSAAALALPDDAQQPVRLQADQVVDDPARGVSVLTGDVRIDQGSLRVQAETVRVFSRERRVVRIVAEGADEEPATLRQRLRPGEPFISADAARIDYAVERQRVELKGDARLEQGEREFSGEVIVYDLARGRVVARGGESGGVQLKWQPETPAPPAD